MLKRTTSRAGTVLSGVLARVDVRNRLKEYRVWRVWDEAVGEILAARTEPVRIENGRLVVRVASAAWMHELQFLKEDLRRKLNQAVGDRLVQSLFFIQGEITPRTATRRPETPRHIVNEQVVSGLVPSDTPPETAEALRRIARARLRRFGTLDS